jgi:surface antigen
MYRFLLAAVPLLMLAAVQQPAEARKKSGASQASAQQQCAAPKKKKKRGGFLGAVAGSLAGSALGRAGVPSGIAGISIPVTSLITDAIASKLDCKEQVQAATATTEATRGGVGTSSSWESETRPNVSGSSTVVAQNARSDGASCMTVTDVIIVGGEETTVPKTMCRAPGAPGYTLAA